MSFKLNGKTGCTIKFDSMDICVAYLGGAKVFGCRSSATVSDNSGVLNSKTFTFNETSFTNNFVTDSPHTYNNVYIESLPKVELLKLIGNNTLVGDKFKATNSSSLKFQLEDRYAIYEGVLYSFSKSIDSIITEYNDLGYKLTSNVDGSLVFTNEVDSTDVVTVSGETVDNSDLEFDFQVSDNSEQQLLTNTATFSLVPQGDVNIKPIYVNTPPTVGDNTITMKRSDIKTFTQADFVDDTDPRFFDEQGDQPYELRVDTLPTSGTLTLRGVAVTQGQILSFTNDIATGNFKFTPDVTQTVTGVAFKFSVSDTGSKQFA